LGNVCRAHAIKADKLLEGTGIFRGQAFLLLLLSEKNGLTHSDISRKLEISPAAVTKVIKRLEQLDYVQRKQDASDERVSRVFVKEKGIALKNEMYDLLSDLDKIMLKGFSDEEVLLLHSLLVRVQKNLQIENCAGK